MLYNDFDAGKAGKNVASPESTAGLAERIRLGDEPAESDLVEFFYRRVYAVVLCRVRNPDVAQDLAQEVLMAVLVALREGRLRDETSLAGYVYSMARNRVNDYFRSWRPESRGEPVSTGLDPPDARVDIERQIEERERRAMAMAAIERLGSRDRKILRLTLVEGLKPGEIAARLGLDAVVVRKRKSRALRRARAEIRRRRSRSDR